ncbi:MAG: hypothetical protein OXJ53_02270 [Gammaproteobacteria bacterium]|nr:hypothetical protein [Gammaproteobacteria bacterium]MDE0273567.1 hypothetical protein [Gammaproteobacteria bacterium]
MNEQDASRFIFSAPFRTNIEMDTFSASSPMDAENHIQKIVDLLNGSVSEGCRWTTERGPKSDGDLQFASLNEHDLSPKAKPILCLQVRCEALEQFRKSACVPSGASSLGFNDCRVLYYDDTVAILICDISMGGLRRGAMEVIDAWSVEFCKSLVDWLRPHRDCLERSLLAGSSGRRHRDLFAQRCHLRRFDDRNDSASADGQTMMWVNRIMVVDQQPSQKAMAAWTQTRALDGNWLDLDAMRLLACVGNSVLAGPISERDVLVTTDAVALCTFFYVSQRLFREHLKQLHLDVARATKGVSRSSLSDERFGELRDHVVVMEAEFRDCRLGLQGHMGEVASRLLDVWNYDALASAVEQRSASLETAWSLLREKRRRRYEVILQSVLTVIACAAVMDFVLSLFAVAGDGKVPEDSVAGLIDAAKLVPPDLTLNALLILILVVLPFLVIRGRK